MPRALNAEAQFSSSMTTQPLRSFFGSQTGSEVCGEAADDVDAIEKPKKQILS
jgi:hypothetical protein